MSHIAANDYDRSRERQERGLAALCSDFRIAAIHVRMADMYSERVRSGREPGQCSDGPVEEGGDA